MSLKFRIHEFGETGHLVPVTPWVNVDTDSEVCTCQFPDESFCGTYCEACELDMPTGTIEGSDANVHLLRLIGEI